MEDGETEELRRWRKYRDELRLEALDRHAGQIEPFLILCKQKGLPVDRSHLDFSHPSGVFATYPGLLRGLLGSEIVPDKDGVFLIRDLLREFSFGTREGHFYCPQFVAVAHPHFRRGFHRLNNFYPRFIELFSEYVAKRDECFISLDPDSVRVDVDHYGYREMDTWYGAPFSEAIENIALGIGKLRPSADVDDSFVQAFFSDAYSLDFKWSEKNGIKTFQALELKTQRVQIQVGDDLFYPARYIHAEYDLSKKVFRHVDGAVQYFDERTYLARRDSDFNFNFKGHLQIKAPSVKLFKINSAVTVSDWVELACQFLSGNPLIFEYFTGAYPKYVNEGIERWRARQAN
ncbi:hypothetical protein [Hydrocarboniphaga sp.]|uniref:hypothetical protein n=1 Tax=Hydrocarboniphaga sp. TaxID=2033016 RepID=UPI003D1122EA